MCVRNKAKSNTLIITKIFTSDVSIQFFVPFKGLQTLIWSFKNNKKYRNESLAEYLNIWSMT